MSVGSRRTRASRRGSIIAALGVVALALSGCSADAGTRAASASASDPVPVAGWPSAMAAIGHSGLTGYDSDRRNADAVGNSWATGDNPDVDSVYLRILAHNPAIEGHHVNLAVDGSGVADLLRQATKLVAMTPKPELVIVQSIDNDMQCDGTDDAHLPVYRAGLVKVMDVLSNGLPDATVLFVSQWGAVVIYDAAAFGVDPLHMAGNGPCDTVDPVTKQIVPEKEAGLQTLVDRYFAVVTDVCSAYRNCRTDENAMQGMLIGPDDLAPDLNHLSVAGHAKMAAIAWQVLYPDR